MDVTGDATGMTEDDGETVAGTVVFTIPEVFFEVATGVAT